MSKQAYAIVLFGLAQAMLLLAESNDAYSERLKKIGEYFCRQSINGTVESLKNSTDVPDVVQVGPTLPSVLAKMRASLLQGYTIETQKGEPIHGEPDPRVTHSIIIRCDNDAICLRMSFDAQFDRFHIVGYTGAKPRKLK